MQRLLIDTGAIYAFVARADEHHLGAREFIRDVIARDSIFVLLDLVFAESMSLLKARQGAGVAIRAGRELRRNRLYQWTPLGLEGERDTWAAFQRYADQDWSYTDCALLVVAQQLKIPDIFAFDEHFDQMPYVRRANNI